MLDIRGLTRLPDSWRSEAAIWRDSGFSWRRWDSCSEDWTHDHCRFCSACICDHRDRFPEIEPGERGCYRHAYYAEREKGVYLWVCRTCFKRVREEFGWQATEDVSAR